MKQLRFSTTEPNSILVLNDNLIVKINNIGKLIKDNIKGKTAYIHGEAENIAGFDIPTFIDGNLGQLELPINEQDILMILPSGEYKCKSEYCDEIGNSNCYLITLIDEH